MKSWRKEKVMKNKGINEKHTSMTIWHLLSICGVTWNRKDSEKMASVGGNMKVASEQPADGEDNGRLGFCGGLKLKFDQRDIK